MKKFKEYIQERKDEDYGVHVYQKAVTRDQGKRFRLVWTPNPMGGWYNAIPVDHDGPTLTNVNPKHFKKE